MHDSRHMYALVGIFVLSQFVIFAIIFMHLSSAPNTFPTNSTITIESGMSAAEIVSRFEQADYVRSSDLLLLYLRFFYGTEDIRAGVYSFTEPISTNEVARTIAKIGPSEPLISITFPEGSTVAQFAAIADDKLSAFSLTTFLSYADNYEGYSVP